MSFAELVGNQKIKRVLHSFVKNKILPSALFFVGEDGIGKKTFAIELVKALFCQNKTNYEACSNCLSCKRVITFPIPVDRDEFRKVIFSGHTDFGMILPYNKNILVEAIRDLELQANLAPYEAERRIFVIDEAEKMNLAAANALLKILEEPPATTNIILISSLPNLILPTVLSRCQILNFAPIESNEMIKFLATKKKIPVESAKILASCARGNLAKALASDLQGLAEKREVAFEVLKLLVAEDFYRLLQITDEIENDYEEFLGIFESLVRDLWVIKLGNTNELVNMDIKQRLASFAENLNKHTLSLWIEEIESLREKMKFNLNKRVASDTLFIKMRNTL